MDLLRHPNLRPIKIVAPMDRRRSFGERLGMAALYGVAAGFGCLIVFVLIYGIGLAGK